METSLQIKSRAEIKIMNDPTLTQYEITQAHAALREKWMI